MSDYSAFFLMKPEDVKRYAVEVLHFFQPEEETDCVEIGDGNINYVFQVRSRKDGRSVIVKQADKLLRSSGRPLDLYRNKIEAETLMLEARLAPKFIPEVYHYDETMAALSMEDISAYKNLRKELAAGRVYGHLSENLSDFLAQSLLPTTDLVMDRQEKKKQVKFFTNPELCDITEDLVLTEPYLAQPMNPRNKNIVTPGNEDFVRTRLYEDEALHGEVAALRNGFMNNAQALIHGDLHTGSIFVKQDSTRVFDPEFAFYGPMGYDIGNVVANMIFAWDNGRAAGADAFCDWCLKAIADTIDLFCEKFLVCFDACATDLMAKTPGFKECYLDSILSDTAAYAGTELIRRKLGKDAYAMTITLLTDSQGKKMGKTAGNAVWLDPNKTSPFEFYQYWRNVGDSDVMKCIRMLTFLPLEQIDEMSTWKDQRLNEAKEILAFELTKMVHGEEEAAKAQNAARALFSGAAGDAEHMPNTQLTEADLTDGSIGILTLMVKAGLAASNGEARRLVVQGGVLVDGEKVAAPTVSFTAEQLSKGIVIKKGKKVYHKVSL